MGFLESFLELGALEAPFSPWVNRYGPGKGSALFFVSRFRTAVPGSGPLLVSKREAAFPHWQTVGPEEREQAIVFTYNYGVAGAVDRLGRERGLPPAASGHNNYWFWRTHGRSAEVVIVVGGTQEGHERRWESVELITETDCGYCMPYENDRPVWICRRLRQSLQEVWPGAKHYD